MSDSKETVERIRNLMHGPQGSSAYREGLDLLNELPEGKRLEVMIELNSYIDRMKRAGIPPGPIDSGVYPIKQDPTQIIDSLLNEVPAPSFREKLDSTLAGLPDASRSKVLDGLKAELEIRESRTGKRLQHVRLTIAVLRELADWLGDGDLRIEQAQSSRSHETISAIKAGDRAVTYDQNVPDIAERLQFVNTLRYGDKPGQVFVVEHDWAAAFEDAAEYDDKSAFRLPYDRCTFEFSVRGRRVVADAVANRDDFNLAFMVELRTSIRSGWFAFDATDDFSLDLAQVLMKQIRAICVSLEAEITYADAIRIPDKLRKARERDGKLPPFDHHVVRLNRRPRAARYEGEHGPGRPGKRLHFRRGHWRHYASHRTWIKWTLVGNPDLGFVDKEYRL